VEILKTDYFAGARQARGIAVIIDVFRAFSVACYCVENGAARILPVGKIEDALRLKQQLPGSILIGERHGKKLEGCDFGNSPTELQGQNFTGRTIIHTTHAGTQGLVHASAADQVLTGAFVNAEATADYITSQAPEQVTLVRMGWEAQTPTDEDTLCADYLEHLLLDRPYDLQATFNQLKQSSCTDRFRDPAQPWSPTSDIDLCLRSNVFPFALRAVRNRQDIIELKPC
jgi:2-phosphosulfolactate phosphatase